MAASSHRTVTQKEFFKTAESAGVRYAYPGIFQAGDVQVTVPIKHVARFLEKLKDHMTFDPYDRLARAVWVEHRRCMENSGPFASRVRPPAGDEEPGKGRGR